MADQNTTSGLANTLPSGGQAGHTERIAQMPRPRKTSSPRASRQPAGQAAVTQLPVNNPDAALHEQVTDLENMAKSAMATAGKITQQAKPRGRYTSAEIKRLLEIADLVIEIERRITQLKIILAAAA